MASSDWLVLATDGSEQEEAMSPRVEARYAPGEARVSVREAIPRRASTDPEEVRRGGPEPKLKVAERGCGAGWVGAWAGGRGRNGVGKGKGWDWKRDVGLIGYLAGTVGGGTG